MTAKRGSKQHPQTIEDVDRDVREIDSIDNQLNAIDAELQTQISQFQERVSVDRQILEHRRGQLVGGVKAYAETHRDELTGGKSKTIKLPGGGVLQWRKRPPQLNVTAKAAVIIAALKRRGHTECVRVKEEIDKQELLRRPIVVKSIPGLSIKPGEEEFIIKPQG